MHVVDRDGSVSSAGDAVIRLMAIFPRTRAISWVARLVPPVRARIARRYEELAARRAELSEKVPDADPTIVRPAWVRPSSG